MVCSFKSNVKHIVRQKGKVGNMKIGYKKGKGTYGEQVFPCVAEKVYRVADGQIICIEGETLEGVTSCSVHCAMDNITEVECRLYAHKFIEAEKKHQK